MAGETTPLPIIRTKLHRPPVAGDHVHRTRLTNRLNKRLYRPLTLVSAPAGYGKSTLVSCWLEDCELPHCWINLDKRGDKLFVLAELYSPIQITLDQVSIIENELAARTKTSTELIVRTLNARKQKES